MTEGSGDKNIKQRKNLKFMEYDLYLLWVPNEGWGVFGYGCPDPGAFPNWMYRKYTIPIEQRVKVFGRLMDIKERLEVEKVRPTKMNERKIFPELSDLLAD